MSTAPTTAASPPRNDRALWLATLTRIVDPVLEAAAERRLMATMPLEARDLEERRPFAMLETIGRTLVGLAPWLACDGLDAAEAAARDRHAELARAAIGAITDPASPDFATWGPEIKHQPVVDAAFLAHALLRAPDALWHGLDPAVRSHVIDGLTASRQCTCWDNNWLLFGAIIEAALWRFTGACDFGRVNPAINRHVQWYRGDGIYSDGNWLHADYYNSFVISPMLLDVLEAFAGQRDDWDALLAEQRRRAQRAAGVLERLISPEGTYPPIGRSLAYRVGAFQLLGQMALRHELPEGISPAQVRCALTAVIDRQFAAAGTFTDAGFLAIGLAGHQPGLGEHYISTASLYLCTAGFLPLGLPPSDQFWADPPAVWTAKALWAGMDQPADHALREA